MGRARLASRWLVAATSLVAACSGGVLGGSSGGAFGSPTETSPTASQGDVTGASAGESDHGEPTTDVASEDGGSEAPAESSGAAGSSGAGSSEGAPASCGDDVRAGDEACDGSDLGGASCADFGFDDGVLACDPACDLITDACFTCGDGEAALGEVCDGSDLGGETCVTLGFGSGDLTCSADCQQLLDDGCIPLPSCGDGLLNGGEQCDGNQLGGASCVTQGFDLGDLGCTGSCTFDLSACMDDLSDCGMMGDLCIFDENDPQGTCCPAGVGGNVFGICDVFLCV